LGKAITSRALDAPAFTAMLERYEPQPVPI